MKKINIKNYEIEVFNPKEGKMVKAPMNIKESIINVLFNRELKLNMIETIKADEIAKKILSAKDDILLEESEYATVKRAFDSFRGFGKNEVELCKRILNSETVKVTEAPKNKK